MDPLVRPLLKAQQETKPSQSNSNPCPLSSAPPQPQMSPKGSVGSSLGDISLMGHSEPLLLQVIVIFCTFTSHFEVSFNCLLCSLNHLRYPATLNPDLKSWQRCILLFF